MQYSGGDVTIMPIIGHVITNDIIGTPTTHSVVEIIHDKEHIIYVTNEWYKEYKRIPLIIHSILVKEYKQI